MKQEAENMKHEARVGGFILLLASCFVLLLSRPVSAQTLTLDEAVSRALANNPAIQAAQEETKAARARVPQAVTPENPEVGIMFDKTPINTFDVEEAMSIDYRIKQTIPFPTKLVSRGKAAKREFQAVLNMQRQTALNITTDVKKVFFNILLVDKKLEIEEYNRDLFKRYSGVAETRYATNQSPFDDPIKASLEAAYFENRLSELTQERASLVAELGYLMGEQILEDVCLAHNWPEVDIPRRTTHKFTYQINDLIDQALKNQPALRASHNMKEASSQRLALAKQQYLPDVMAEFAYNQRRNEQDAWTGAFGITLPLWFFGRQQPVIREARAIYNASTRTYEDTSNKLMASVIDAHKRIKSAERIVKIYEEAILPRAKANLRSAETSYLTGKADFLNLVDSARKWKEYQIDYWEAHTNFEVAIAEMEALVGTSLPFVRGG